MRITDVRLREETGTLVPMMKNLYAVNEMSWTFKANPLKPVDGSYSPPKGPGIGIDLDESKIESERLPTWM